MPRTYPKLEGVSDKADHVVKHALGISYGGAAHRNAFCCERTRAECLELEEKGWLVWQELPEWYLPEGGIWRVTEQCMRILGVNPDDTK